MGYKIVAKLRTFWRCKSERLLKLLCKIEKSSTFAPVKVRTLERWAFASTPNP